MRKYTTQLALSVVAVLTACASAGSRSAGTASEVRQLEALLEVPAAAATSRVQAAFADNGLAISSSQGAVVEATDTDGVLKLLYRASIIVADSAATRVVLTAFGTRPAAFGLPEANAQVTSKTGGPGKKVWERLERLRSVLESSPQ